MSNERTIINVLSYMQKHGRCNDLTATNETFSHGLEAVIYNIDLLFEDRIFGEDDDRIINAILCCIQSMTGDTQRQYVKSFCSKIDEILCTSDEKVKSKLNALNFLFYGYIPNELKMTVYTSLLNVELHSTQKHLVAIDLLIISKQLADWECDLAETQSMLRQLHRIFTDRQDKTQATESMIMLLRSFTVANALKSHDDVVRCIVTSLQDPQGQREAEIIELDAVKDLINEPIHRLLTIVNSGSIKEYRRFLVDNPDFMIEHELVEMVCLGKIRSKMLLTVLDTKNMSLPMIEDLFHLPTDDILKLTNDQLHVKEFIPEKEFVDINDLIIEFLKKWSHLDKTKMRDVIIQDNMVVSHTEPIYIARETLLTNSKRWSDCVFTVTCENETTQNQKHRALRDIPTESLFKIQVHRGIKKGDSFKVHLTSPAEINGEYRFEYIIENGEEHLIKKTYIWHQDSDIIVAPWSRMETNVFVTQDEYNADFTIDVTIKGSLIMQIVNKKTKDVNKITIANLGEVFTAEKGFIAVDNNTVKYIVRGTCSGKHVIKKKVHMMESPLVAQSVRIL